MYGGFEQVFVKSQSTFNIIMLKQLISWSYN